MRVRMMLRATSALLALLGLLLAVTGVGRAAGAVVSLTSAPDTVEVLAQGFQPGETITVWLTGPRGQTVATNVYHAADDQGAARFPLVLSVANEVGRWTITVYGLDSELEAYAQVDRETAGAAAADDDGDDEDEDDEDSDTDDDGDTDGDSD
ncbi:MAG: hypothetical protein IT340_16110 [Chloroflexi bacterium]|nr:hypothetical protein [Chloroflexota bacterium]